MKKIVTIVGSLTLALTLHAQERYSVDDLILKSLENSPDMHISRANYDASKSRVRSAFANYLPSVDLIGSAGEAGMENTLSPSKDMVHDTVLLGQLSAKELLYDFGKTSATVDGLEYDSRSFRMQNLQDISDKKRDVKEAYYNVLSALALVVVQKENVKLNEAQLYRSEKYFEAGIRTKIDVSDAKVTLIQSKLDLKRAEYDVELAFATLDAVVGFTDVHRNYTIYSKELDLKHLFMTLPQYDLDLSASIEYAYKNRAIIKKQQSLLDASRAKIKSVEAEYYPSLYVSADYTKQSVNSLALLLPEDKWQASINLNYNLYNGGNTTARKQEKKIAIQNSSSAVALSKLRIKKETTRAYLNLNKSKDSVELSQSLVQVSSEKFDQASKRYEHGLSDYIELQQARQGYIDAKAALVIDYYRYFIAIAYLDNAIGR